MKILSDCSTCFDHASRRSWTSYCGNNTNNERLVNEATWNTGFILHPVSLLGGKPDLLYQHLSITHRTDMREQSILLTCNRAASLYRLKLAPTDLNDKVMRIGDKVWEILRFTSHCISSCTLCGHRYLPAQQMLRKKRMNTYCLSCCKEKYELGQEVNIHVTYATLCSIKWLGVVLLPLYGMLICQYPPLFHWVGRGCVL